MRIYAWTLILPMLLLTGCDNPAYHWHDVSLSAPPWIAPGQTIVWQQRTVFMPLENRAAPIEYRMLDATRKPLTTPYEAATLVSNALRKTPAWNQWPASDANHRTPPYEFALVALNPTVVLAWDPQGAKYLICAAGAGETFGYMSDMRDPAIPGLTKGLVCSAIIPAVDNVYWFSPDMGSDAADFRLPHRIDSTHLRIPLPNDDLILSGTPHAWEVSRVPRDAR